MNALQSRLCEACANHAKEYTHLAGGRGMQHLLSDNEITLMIAENNRKDLLSVLTVRWEDAKTRVGGEGQHREKYSGHSDYQG